MWLNCWLKTASAKISDVALRILIQFLITIIIIDGKDLPFPSSFSILTAPKSCTRSWLWLCRPADPGQVWLSDNHKILSNFQLLKPPKHSKERTSQIPVTHLKSICLSETHVPMCLEKTRICPLLVSFSYKRGRGKPSAHGWCWFRSRKSIFEWENLWSETFRSSPGENWKQEQRALHPSNSHGTSLRKGWKQGWEPQAKIQLIILSLNSVMRNQTLYLWYHHLAFIGNKWFRLEWTPSLEMKTQIIKTYLKGYKMSIMPLKNSWYHS